MPAGAKAPVPTARDNRPPTAKMRARAATAEEMHDEDDYEMAEPNMKLSHAIIVVLILHVIAVGGVFAFSSLKNRPASDRKAEKPVAQETAPAATEKSVEAAAPVASAPAPAPAVKPSATEAAHGKSHTVAAGDTLTSIASANGTTVEAIAKENGITSTTLLHVGQTLKLPATTSATKTAAPEKIKTAPSVVATVPKTAESAKTATASSDVYVVAKGENPYLIAKKLHVSYTELLEYNNITDPKKIQIGQKLKVPKK